MATTMAMNKLHTFLLYASAHMRLFWPSIERNFHKNRDLFEEVGIPMVDWAAVCLGDDYAKKLTDGYAKFVTDVNRSQMKYEKSGTYQNKTYEGVFDNVYDNREHMSLYHWGVYVTTFAWEHHLRIYRFFRDSFISCLESREGLLLDMGSGSGIWGLLLIRLLPEWKVRGVDISRTSIDFANRMTELNGFGSRAAYFENDALTYSLSERSHACISCFLMEHLETPQDLLVNMARNLRDRGFAFVTAALTAAEVDHITEFRCESELILMAEKAGFRVLASYSASPDSYNRENRFLPRSMALVLQKRMNDIW